MAGDRGFILKYFRDTIRTVGHDDITDESPALRMDFRRELLQYTLESLQWRPTDNDPCFTCETP